MADAAGAVRQKRPSDGGPCDGSMPSVRQRQPRDAAPRHHGPPTVVIWGFHIWLSHCCVLAAIVGADFNRLVANKWGIYGRSKLCQSNI